MPVFTTFSPVNYLKPLALSLPVALACSTSAFALAPQEAWTTISAFLTGTGAQVRVGSTVQEGDAYLVRDVAIIMSREGNGPRLNFPQIRLSSEGEQVRITPSQTFTLTGVQTALPADPSVNVERNFSVTHNGSLVVGLDASALSLNLAFPQFDFTQTSAKSSRGDLQEQFALNFTGLNGSLGLPLVMPYGIDLRLTADGLVQTVDQAQSGPFSFRQQASGTSTNLGLTLTGTNFPGPDNAGEMPDILRSGFEARLNLTAGASTTQMTVSGDVGTGTLALDTSPSSMSAEVVNSQFSLSMDAGASRGTVSYEGASGPVSVDRVAMALGMPLAVTPDARLFHFGFTLENLNIAPALVQDLGLAPLASQPLTLDLDIQAPGRLLFELDDDAFDRPNANPVDLVQLDLARMRAAVGGAELTGAGNIVFTPGSFARIAEQGPDGTGAFTFDLRGANALLVQLVQAGMIPADQQFAAQMGINMFGRPVGEDHVRSEVVIRPGRQVTVNGAPIPF